MPTYATVANVLALMPSIGSATSITSASIAQYLNDAEAEINGKVVQRYTLPFSSTPPLLTTLETRMATADLLTLRAMAQFNASDQKGNTFFDRLKEARKTLDAIAGGFVQLVDSAGALIAERTDVLEVWSNNQNFNPTMTEAHVTQMPQDSSKIDTILGDRDILT